VRRLQWKSGEAGYVEHRNIGIDYSWAEGRADRLPALPAELASRPVSVIAATGGPPSARAAKAASSTIPIVFVVGSDPVREGDEAAGIAAGADPTSGRWVAGGAANRTAVGVLRASPGCRVTEMSR
jgi:putative tryptophan/tyrosine transport system substrate-binding protein